MNLKQQNTTLIGVYDNFEFGISSIDRARNMHLLGQTGSGKSFLMHQMIVQDVYNKMPFIYFDYIGDSYADVVEKVPNYNIDQLYFINSENSESLIGLEYDNISKTKSEQIINKLVSTFQYKNIIDERVGIIFDVKIDNFISNKDRELFVSLIMKSFVELLHKRSSLNFYQKPLFTFYLDELQFLDKKIFREILDNTKDFNCCIVSANQFIGQLDEMIAEDITTMYGNHIFFRPVDEDVNFVAKFLKNIKQKDLLDLDAREAFFRIFSDGERQKEFKAKVYNTHAQNFGFGKIILKK